MDSAVTQLSTRDDLLDEYQRVRHFTEHLCKPLAIDDYQLQSIVQTSPPKWHLAHVSWFFETFVLSHFATRYRVFHPQFDYLFNSYYYTHGSMHPRAQRGLLSRPTVEEVYAYRAHVDKHMQDLIMQVKASDWHALQFRVTLGLHHEQQHQELLLMDIKHNFSVNPLLPAYRNDLLSPHTRETALNWVESEAGQVAIGHAGTDFAYDNETPRHERLLHRHRLADRLVTNAEYLEFIEEGGYQNPALWLADGWALVQKTGWQHPLYWHRQEKDWMQYSLGGLRALELYEPVCHVSYYEADAYARWAGKRLPLEEELEYRLEQEPLQGNFVEDELLHPQAVKGPSQWYGDLWNWTASPYMPYPGFKPMAGSIGEYNGKFMSNQMVLKGGCCVTSRDHVRASYRNFFYPDERWAFTGIRLAEDVE